MGTLCGWNPIGKCTTDHWLVTDPKNVDASLFTKGSLPTGYLEFYFAKLRGGLDPLSLNDQEKWTPPPSPPSPPPPPPLPRSYRTFLQFGPRMIFWMAQHRHHHHRRRRHHHQHHHQHHHHHHHHRHHHRRHTFTQALGCLWFFNVYDVYLMIIWPMIPCSE